MVQLYQHLPDLVCDEQQPTDTNITMKWRAARPAHTHAPGVYLRCSLSHALKPESISLFPFLGRVTTLRFYPGCIQPCYSSAHCCFSDSRRGWESKVSEAPAGAALVQQGSAIARLSSGCLCTAREGWLTWLLWGIKGTLKTGFCFQLFLLFPHWANLSVGKKIIKILMEQHGFFFSLYDLYFFQSPKINSKLTELRETLWMPNFFCFFLYCLLSVLSYLCQHSLTDRACFIIQVWCMSD